MYPAMTEKMQVMDGKRREGIKLQREEKDTKGRSPSMPETWNVAVSKCGKEVSGMGGYEGMYPAMTESRRMCKPQREERGTKARSPSMPDTQSIAWRNYEKEVSGIAGYEGHVSCRN
jgi:hypothetical protein